MNLPEELLEIIEHEIKLFSKKELFAAVQELSLRYRSHNPSLITSDLHRAAYLLYRMPATFAAISEVFREIVSRISPSSFLSMLDLGAGPGTATWAASQFFSELNQLTLVEQDLDFMNLGKRLMKTSKNDFMQKAFWVQGRFTQDLTLPPHDLVVISYALGEQPQAVESLMQKIWQSSPQAVVIIEPGTMNGFDIVRRARKKLLSLGAQPLAPCPHSLECPMGSNDWCHFSRRLERTRQHRDAKQGILNYEDEKYSYFVATRTSLPLPKTRVLRHPKKHSGHVELFLCTPEGLQEKIVSRREGSRYKEARKAVWGTGISNETY